MTASTETRDLIVTSSPHVSSDDSVQKIMHTVWIALVPACAAAVWVFGWMALFVIALTTAATVAFEVFFLKMKGLAWRDVWSVALDGSAIVTGVLLALNLPPASPWWLLVVGALIAMGLGKHVFGGLGNNPFNPALVARVFLLISFPVQMVSWTPPVSEMSQSSKEAIASYQASGQANKAIDGESYATPLGGLKESLRGKDEVARVDAIEQVTEHYSIESLFVGRVGGSLGEVSALALLLGAGLLFFRKIITWHIPVSFIVATAVFTGVPWLVDPTSYINPLYHILSGGLLLGAFFMATDMVTSPVTPVGMLIFGAGAGLITAVIRLWGAYPEGVSFAILIMNGLVPLIDKYTKPKKFGETGRAVA